MIFKVKLFTITLLLLEPLFNVVNSVGICAWGVFLFEQPGDSQRDYILSAQNADVIDCSLPSILRLVV